MLKISNILKYLKYFFGKRNLKKFEIILKRFHFQKKFNYLTYIVLKLVLYNGGHFLFLKLCRLYSTIWLNFIVGL
jgi:hypothetical protein